MNIKSKKALKLFKKHKGLKYDFIDNIIEQKPHKSAKLCNKIMDIIEKETGLKIDTCEAINGLRIKLAEENY